MAREARPMAWIEACAGAKANLTRKLWRAEVGPRSPGAVGPRPLCMLGSCRFI